jgi:hypothetical protein
LEGNGHWVTLGPTGRGDGQTAHGAAATFYWRSWMIGGDHLSAGGRGEAVAALADYAFVTEKRLRWRRHWLMGQLGLKGGMRG